MILPILVLALIRRLNAEERAARQIATRTERDRLAAERAARVRAETAAESEAWQRQSEARLLPVALAVLADSLFVLAVEPPRNRLDQEPRVRVFRDPERALLVGREPAAELLHRRPVGGHG